MAAPERLLACAVSSQGMATIVLDKGRLRDWQLSRAVLDDHDKARSKLRLMAHEFGIDIFATENPFDLSRKGLRARSLLHTLIQTMQDEAIRTIPLRRIQLYPNKYEEAEALSQRFTEIAGHCPRKPKVGVNPPRDILYFEALSYTVTVLDSPELLVQLALGNTDRGPASE